MIIYKILYEHGTVVQNKNFASSKMPKLQCMYRCEVHTHYFLIYQKSLLYDKQVFVFFNTKCVGNFPNNQDSYRDNMLYSARS